LPGCALSGTCMVTAGAAAGIDESTIFNTLTECGGN